MRHQSVSLKHAPTPPATWTNKYDTASAHCCSLGKCEYLESSVSQGGAASALAIDVANRYIESCVTIELVGSLNRSYNTTRERMHVIGVNKV